MTDQHDIQKLVGLKYTPGEGLPRVIVKSSGKVAEKILSGQSLVKRPAIVKNRELVEKLYRLPVDAEISRDAFYMVAIILTHIFSVEEKLGRIDE